MRLSSNAKISASASRPTHPHLPVHVLEHHRKVLATILKKRLTIEQWRRHVGSEVTPKARPTYQNRLSQEFADLRTALPDRLQAGVHDRVSIMASAMSYIVYLKNSLHKFRGEKTERVPTYNVPRLNNNITPLQARTHKENCMIRMLTQVLPTISVMPSKIQLIEHATQTICRLEMEYYHLLQAQSKHVPSTASSVTSMSAARSRREIDMEVDSRSISSAAEMETLPSIRSAPRSRDGPSANPSAYSMSCPPTPKDMGVDFDIEVRSMSSSDSSERLPSIREILRDKTIRTDLRLPPLRFTTL